MIREGMARRLALLAALVLAGGSLAGGRGTRAAGGGFGPGDWPMFMRDAARSGANTAETALTPTTVGQLRRLWVRTLAETADSTPIRLAGVALPDGSHQDLVFITTSRGTTYAFEARTGAQVWRYLPAPGPRYTTSSPVADPSRRWIYAPGVDGKVHKLAAATGREAIGGGWPATITLMPDIEKHSSALNLANGYLYAATGGYPGDQGTYTGHVVAIRLADGQTTVFNTLCSDVRRLLLDRSRDPRSRYACAQYQSGVWARAGTVVEPQGSPLAGRVYAVTGNGHFDANLGGHDYGDSLLALSGDLGRLLDYWTPPNQNSLRESDTDLGSTTPLLLPYQRGSATPWLAVQGGKDARLRLLNRLRLGHVGGELQSLVVPGGGILTASAVWSDPQPRTRADAAPWIISTNGEATTALRLRTADRGRSRLSIAWSLPLGATSPALAGGLVFAATDGDLFALDLHTGKRLWSARATDLATTVGGIHWQSPIVVAGTVIVSDNDRHLAVYGLR